jgi:hypothetical protein
MVAHTGHLSYVESLTKRIVVQISQGNMKDVFQKKLKQKRAGKMTQVKELWVETQCHQEKDAIKIDFFLGFVIYMSVQN